LSWIKSCEKRQSEAVVSLLLNHDDLRKSTPTFAKHKKINEKLDLKWKLHIWKDFTWSSTVKVNDHVKLGFGTGFELSKDGVKSITGDGSFKLPVGFSLNLKS